MSVCQKIKLQSPSIIVGVKNNRRIYIGDITSRFVKVFQTRICRASLEDDKRYRSIISFVDLIIVISREFIRI